MENIKETAQLAALYKQPIGRVARILLGSALPPEAVKAAVRYQALQFIAHELGVFKDDQGKQIPASARMKPMAEVERDIAVKAEGAWQGKVSEAEQVIGLTRSIQLPGEIPPFNAILTSGVAGYSMDRSVSENLLLLQAGLRAHALLEGKVDFFEPKLFDQDPESLQKIQSVVIKGMQGAKANSPLRADLGALGSEAILIATGNLKAEGVDVIQQVQAYITTRTGPAQPVSLKKFKGSGVP